MPEQRESAISQPTREKRCVWCGYSKWRPNRCICDEPKFVVMERCADCGDWFKHSELDGEETYERDEPICRGCAPL